MENGKMRIGVIFGGLSAEAEVSLATGRYVYSLLDPQGFDGLPFYLDKMGQLWLLPDKLVIQNTTLDLEARLERDGTRVSFESLPEKVDCVFNALLGKYGEDGCIQGVLELLGVPYTGSGILASALGMDKKVHKRLLRGQGFLVARDVVISNIKYQISKIQIKDQIEKEIGWPCVVKPTREGSSIGVSVVKKTEELDLALEVAFQYDNEVLVEEYLQGMEYTCVVWGNENPQAMLPTEVVFEGDFFTYEGKYMPGRTRTITPARVSKEVLGEIQRIAADVYKLIGCVGYGRVDGFVLLKQRDQTRRVCGTPFGSGTGRSVKESFDGLGLESVDIYVTEPHTGTIMVPSSFVFQQAAKFKIDIQQKFTGKKVSTPLTPRMLVTRIIELALEAHQNKKGLL